jgi:hypothetical protein
VPRILALLLSIHLGKAAGFVGFNFGLDLAAVPLPVADAARLLARTCSAELHAKIFNYRAEYVEALGAAGSARRFCACRARGV